MIFAGLLVGNLSGGFIADAFGRRAGLLGMGCLFCVAGTFSAFAPDIYTFAVARFLTGICVGAMIPVADAHVLELSPREWRAKLAMSLVGAAFAVGTLIACAVGIGVHESMGHETSWWRLMLIICIIPGFMSLPLMEFLLPESMHWLAVNGRQDECKELLKDLAEVNGTELLAGGAVSVDKFNPVDKGEEDSQLPMNWRFLEIFGTDVTSVQVASVSFFFETILY